MFVWLVDAFDASYIAHYRSNGYAPLHRTLSLKLIWPAVSETLVLNETKHTKRSQIKICENRQMRNVQFQFMQNAFRILKPIQKSSKCVWVFRNTGANAFAKNQTRLAYEDKCDLYCIHRSRTEVVILYIDMGVRFGREPKWLYSGCLWGVRFRAGTEFVCVEAGLRFGREPKCVRGKTVIPWRIIYV